jgi:hypothetical protein
MSGPVPDDTPRDPLAALWKQIVYEEEERPVVGLDPLGDRIFARLVAAGVTLDATRPSGDPDFTRPPTDDDFDEAEVITPHRPSGDEALRAALLEASRHECWDGDNFIARPLTHLAALATPSSTPASGDEALRPWSESDTCCPGARVTVHAPICATPSSTPDVEGLLAMFDEFAPRVDPSDPAYLRWLKARAALRDSRS